jgi:hypothetical protein
VSETYDMIRLPLKGCRLPIRLLIDMHRDLRGYRSYRCYRYLRQDTGTTEGSDSARRIGLVGGAVCFRQPVKYLADHLSE